MAEAPDGIHVRGLTKHFGSTTALYGVDLSVGAGDVVVLLGENGAGKSTLIRIVLGTVLPDAGSAVVARHDVATDGARARARCGFVVGSERSWELRISGRDNLRFFAALYGIRRSDADAMIDGVLGDVDLLEAADRPVSGYSSGMRLRLALARALLHRPSVLLLDEPTHALDPVATDAFHRLLDEVRRRDDVAVLFATHDLHEAAAIADRVVVLRHGRIEATLDPPFESAALAAQLTAA